MGACFQRKHGLLLSSQDLLLSMQLLNVSSLSLDSRHAATIKAQSGNIEQLRAQEQAWATENRPCLLKLGACLISCLEMVNSGGMYTAFFMQYRFALSFTVSSQLITQAPVTSCRSLLKRHRQ